MRVLAFLDSSVVVQSFKEDKKALEIIKELYNSIERIKLCINVVVFSEVIYQLTYKRKFALEKIDIFLSKFKFFPTDEEVKKESFKIYVSLFFKTQRRPNPCHLQVLRNKISNLHRQRLPNSL